MASKCGVPGPRTSGSQVASQDAASKCGVTCLRGVLPTWREGATCGRRSSASAHASGLTWRCRTRRQNVASLPHVASGSHVASPDVASKRGVRRHRSMWRHRTWRQNVASRSQASRHVSSKCVFSRRAICAPPQATTLEMLALSRIPGLSGGQRARVSLARVAYNQHAVLRGQLGEVRSFKRERKQCATRRQSMGEQMQS